MVELVPKIRRLSILFSARVHVKFSIIGRPRLLILSITRPRPYLKSRCPYNSVGKITTENYLLKNSFQKFHGQRFFLLLYKGQGGGTIESNRTKTKRQI